MRFLITAGGTREYIDPVRFISNASSGRMGYALARAALRRGCEVVLVAAPTGLKAPCGAELVSVESAQEMFRAVKAYFDECDCLIMAAAVADYRPTQRAARKLKKGRGGLTLRLKPTDDILKWAGMHKRPGQVLVGFALEDRSVLQAARRKLVEKRLDMIVANTPTAVAQERSSVDILTADGQHLAIEDQSKQLTARRIIRMACERAGP
ncbi:MAG TPA: phosphopantothenoylcysteine decarboxylase [Phycisphaerales bacterium]|nr:phosphopantothenoylcysteine decarboxylase [Phycisphaerales bacterium]